MRLDEQLSRAIPHRGHRFDPVHHEIENDLLQLHAVSEDRREIGGKFQPQRHAFSSGVIPRQQNDLLNGLVNIQLRFLCLGFLHERANSGDYLAPVFGDGTSPNFFAERALRFEGVRRVNTGLSYRLPLGEFKAARFYVRGENLLDQNYFESGFRTPGRTALGGMQFEF